MPNRWITCFVALSVSITAGSAAQADAPPLVLAAASFQEVLNAEADAWVKLGHAKPTLAFAASSALAHQIDSGAPADIFISADEEWMDEVAQKGGTRPGSRGDVAANALVLITPAQSRVVFRVNQRSALVAALQSHRIALADPDSVPAGRYAKATLDWLGIWGKVAASVIRAENVRAALALVARGEAPLGIVYATDARVSDKISVLGVFPDASHPPIRYPAALLRNGSSRDAAPFLAFLRSSAGRKIMRRFGFGPA